MCLNLWWFINDYFLLQNKKFNHALKVCLDFWFASTKGE